MSTDFPDTFIRGIPNNDFIDEESNYPKSDLFKNFEPNADRIDDFLELSINWNDDEGAMIKILEQKKENSSELQFKVWGAILDTNELKNLCKKPLTKDILKYERKEIENNEYHGNILMKNGTAKRKRNEIAAGLAFCVGDVHFR